MVRMWQFITTLFSNEDSPRGTVRFRSPVVALVLNEQDRLILNGISGREPVEMHFAESFEEASVVANRLNAPVILLDRDWPGIEWRTAVESLAFSTHKACVVLVSGVADEYLWQEVIRRGGYDVLPKPLHTDTVARILKLALSYWNSTPKSAVPARKA